jgi:hypothetical protein
MVGIGNATTQSFCVSPDKRANRTNEVLLHISGNATYQELSDTKRNYAQGLR